jgi:hypothetical protein
MNFQKGGVMIFHPLQTDRPFAGIMVTHEDVTVQLLFREFHVLYRCYSNENEAMFTHDIAKGISLR